MGLELICNCKKCGYNFDAYVGVDMLYPKVYSETVAKMKEGQFGEQGKEFFEVFPNGAISCENIVVQCNDCGQLMVVPDLTLYIPREGYNLVKQNKRIPWSTGFCGKGYEYISFSELHNHYQLFEQYDHRCTNCGGHTSVVIGFTERMDESIDRHVRCSECGSMMKIDIVGSWD
ncbi:hypothetical protein QUW58_23115 [Enterocloster aldenensis]|uniref:hypothetical protein n=1 Tax=Enterocloster aldenensis TaxID=358742 RepID=UPI0025A484B8|nr:hypothetical protein [Enterocloster aldenensis]